MKVNQVSERIHVSGMTGHEDLQEVLGEIVSRGVGLVLCMTLVPDRRLAAMAEQRGFAYEHVPLKSGAPPFAAQRMIKRVKDEASVRVVLLVGETADGPALRIARSAHTGKAMPRRGRMYGG